jgi:hypothetical protein
VCYSAACLSIEEKNKCLAYMSYLDSLADGFGYVYFSGINDKYILDESSGDYMPLKLSRLIVESFTLLFSTVWLFSYAVQLNDHLTRVAAQSLTDANHTSVSSRVSAASGRQQKSVKRIVVVLFICCISYFLRVLCLLILIVDIFQDKSRSDRFDNVGWFFLSNWIPTLVPGVLFLYTSRVVRVEETKNNTALQDMFKEGFEADMYGDDDTTTNPVHSTDVPSVNIDGIERPSEDYEAERRMESVDSLPPRHLCRDSSGASGGESEGHGGQYRGSEINMTNNIGFRNSFFSDD